MFVLPDEVGVAQQMGSIAMSRNVADIAYAYVYMHTYMFVSP